MASEVYVPVPARKAPKGGLLAVANVIDSGDPHILQGVRYVPEGCDMPDLTPGSCWTTVNPVDELGDPITEKTPDGVPTQGTMMISFILHAGVECLIGPDEDYLERAENALAGGESVAVERAVFANLFTPLASAGNEADLVAGVARAEQYLSANYPALGLIHLDRRQASLAAKSGTIEKAGEHLETLQGLPVANGGGYGADDGSERAPHTIFATGQVNIWRSPVISNMTTDPTKNTRLALAERFYAVSIDCDIAAKITLTTP